MAALLLSGGSASAIDVILGEEVERETASSPFQGGAAADNTRDAESKPGGMVFRVRVTRLSPEQPAAIKWRYGGEGLGGSPVGGCVTTEKPLPPPAPVGDMTFSPELDALTQQLLDEDMREPKLQDRVRVEGKTDNKVYLFPKVWSKEVPVSALGGYRGNLSLTFEAEGLKSFVNGVDLEFEFLYGGQLVKRFQVTGAKGNALGVIIPFHRINADGSPTPEFVQEVGSLKDYVQRKLQTIKEIPWIDRPVPRLYAVITDCYGFAEGSGYAIRTSDPDTFQAEFEILRLLGINGTAVIPAFFAEKRRKKEGIAAAFSRLDRGGYSGGYQIPGVGFINIGGKHIPAPKPGDGCPYYPGTVSNVLVNVGPAVRKGFEAQSEAGVDQFWACTVDEIGSVFDMSPEGKAHQGACPYCREAFREFVRADGRTLADFGATSWDDIRSQYGYWARTYWDSLTELSNVVVQAQAVVDAERKKAFDSRIQTLGVFDEKMATLVEEIVDPEAAKRDVDAELTAANSRLSDLVFKKMVLEIPQDRRTKRLSKEGETLLWYYSARFNCEAGARVFTPLRDAFDGMNEGKRQALARGETKTPAALQPWGYSYALRANTFLMSGHSLDFFNFYRHADNAFVYETSNRDWRVWPWDSYLCDVGRSLSRFMNKQFGLYVKAHRGAPIQRSLAAVARGVRMIYWYTYGPEYVKGDSFGGDPKALREIAWVNRLIAGGEEVTYDSDWAVPADVAVVRPLTSEYMSGTASYENSKWVYTALMHAHIPMDALDEGLLMTEDISRYKVIVISGSHIRRDVALRLAKWVEEGGTLVTSGWGMALDEAGRPLEVLWPVFGLKTRGKFDAWGSVPGYGATRLGSVQAIKGKESPEGAMLISKNPSQGSFTPVVGREVLDPKQSADVMATYADGGAAVVRNRHGKGTAWMIGTYAGVEYAWEPMINTNAEQKWYRADKRSWIAAPVLEAGVRPVVDAEGRYSMWEDAAFVEGHMLRNRKTGALAVVLINWAHRINAPVKIKIRGAGGIRSAKSVATGQIFPLESVDGLLTAVLPKLDEGDILLLTP